MAKERGGRDRSESAGDLHDLRLKTLLDDLVGENAVSRSTAHLDVDHRTLTVSPGSGDRPADAGGAGPGTAGRGMCRKWRERAGDRRLS